MDSRNWWRIKRHFHSNSNIWCEKLMGTSRNKIPNPTSGAPLIKSDAFYNLKILIVKINFNIPKT